MRKVIGMHGYPGAGKDTAAAFLRDIFGFQVVGFADALRQEICQAYVVPVERLTDRIGKETDSRDFALYNCRDPGFVARVLRDVPREDWTREINLPRSPRWTARQWGTEYRREQEDAYWLNRLADRIDGFEANCPVVITDVRFPNEAAFIKHSQGAIWNVIRPGAAGSAHASDIPLPAEMIDAVLHNDGSVLDLRQKTLVLAVHPEEEAVIDLDEISMECATA